MKNETKPDSDMILYQTEDGRTRLQVRLDGETVWLSLNQMADLFQRDKSVISRHIKNVFDEGELSPSATVAKSATVQTEGEKQVTRDIEFYNLDVIISVGYRVKSQRGVQFRIWADAFHSHVSARASYDARRLAYRAKVVASIRYSNPCAAISAVSS